MLSVPVLLSAEHRLDDFACGVDSLDDWLKRRARPNQVSGASIQQSRQQVQLAVNSAMVQCYWQIGRLIVEHEQQGQARAAYGKHQLEALSE